MTVMDGILIAAAAVLSLLLVTAVLVFATRPWWAVAGTRPGERERPLPGDDLVPAAPLVTTRAIDLEAPIAVAWAWLVQVGQDRGGFYSHAWLENLAGCRMRNADRIVPEWQHRAVGDRVPLHPRGPSLIVTHVDPPHAMVLLGDARATDSTPAEEEAAEAPPGDGGSPPARRDRTSWAFLLQEHGPDRCRLIVRTRTDWRPGIARAVLWRGLVDPGHFIMERAMLRGIARRCRRGGRSPRH